MKDNSMDLSERELLAMTSDLDQMHRDLFPRFQIAVSEMTEGWREWTEREQAISRLNATRRTFLRGGLVTAGAVGGPQGPAEATARAETVVAQGCDGAGGAPSSSKATSST